MKNTNILITVLLIIGGLNWGLVGLLNFDLVATLLGQMTVFSRIIYTLVGISAIYYLIAWKSIQGHKATSKG